MTTSALFFCLTTALAFGQAIRVSPEVASQMSQPVTGQGTVAPAQASSPTSPQSQPTKGTASIEGAVATTEGDRPVRKATVTLIPMIPVVNPMQAQDTRQQFQTEADGHFVFKDLPAGQYTLTVQHPNYVGTGRQARMISQQVKLAEAQAVKDVTFRLVPAAVIRGKITDEDGDPVARAQIAVMRQQYVRGKKQMQSVGSSNSDDLGEYRVSSLPPGSYWVSASRMRMGMYSADEAKNPMQYVRTFYPGATEMQSASPVEVKPGDEVPVNISLMKKETAVVKGTVTTATGEKPEIAQVMFSSAGEMPFMGSFSTMVRDGSFEARVPPGHYRVMVMTTSAQSGPMTPSYNNYSIDVPPQGLQDLRFQGAGAQSKITARVSVEGAAQAVNLDNIRLQLSIKRDDDDARNFFTMGDMGSGKADKDGVAVVEKLNPGTFEVNYFGGIPNQQDAYLKSVLQGSREALVNGVRVGGDTTMQVILSVNGGHIEGTVTDANHNPVKGAYVIDVPPEEFRSRDQFYRVATTDQMGHFLLHSIRPGRHLLLALEDPEQGIWLDPEFLKQVESRGENYSIGEREAKQFQLQVVPKAQTTAGQ